MNKRNRYKYTHFVDNKEVTREQFLNSLGIHFTTCDTNYSNPIFNIGFVNTRLLMNAYNRLKRTGIHFLYCCGKNSSYYIKKEVIKNEK